MTNPLPPAFEDLETVRAELADALAPAIVLGAPLARGGMGAVFLARDPLLKRQVVVKVLAPELAHDTVARERFAREAQSAAAISNAHVVNVFQVGTLPRSGTSYFVMQFVDGPTLSEAFPSGTKAPQARCARVVGQVAVALAAAHARGLVHRDIKPSNVMLEGNTEHVIVLDFGISAAAAPERRTGERLTAQGMTIGTPEYMSPEQAAADVVTDKSDVYSLGVVAFELLAGRAPFEGPSAMALAAAHIKDVPPKMERLRPDLNPDFAALIDRMLLKDPARRPAAAEIARALAPMAPVIEWPPPGLERLRGRGTQAMRLIVIGIAIEFCSFLVQVSGMGQGITRVLIVALLGLFGIAVLTVGYAGIAVLAAVVRWAQKSGYPLAIGMDVALDPYHDTDAMLNASGRFASLADGTGWRWITRGRWAFVAVLVGASLTQLGVFLWATGVVAIGEATSGVPMTGADFAVVFAPALLGVAAAVALRWPERAMRGRLRADVPVRKLAPIPVELVTGWMNSSSAPAALRGARRRVSVR